MQPRSPFTKTFFRFVSAFAGILAASLAVILAVGWVVSQK